MPAHDLDQLLQQLAHPDEVLGDQDTYGLELARALEPGERAVFVDKLLQVMGTDRRAIMTAGHLGLLEARPPLFALARTKVRLAFLARRALVMLGDGLSFVTEIAHDALHLEPAHHRTEAIADLGKLRHPVAKAALLVALGDEWDRARVAAWASLVEVYELGPLLRGPAGKPTLSTELELLGVFLNRDLPSFVRMGVEELRRLFGWLDSGVPPAALGIAWRESPPVFQALRAVLFETGKPFPLEEIAQLKGSDRRWGEAMIAFRLEDQDLRVPDALVRLGATWTLPVLEEVAKAEKTPPELREALEQSLRALKVVAKPDWTLAFRNSSSVPIATYEQVLTKLLSSPASTEREPMSGNPRDGFFGEATITAQRPGDGARLQLRLKLDAAFEGDSTPTTSLEGGMLRAPALPFAAKLALWHALRDALVQLGATDGTLAASPAPIVDEAEAAGDGATAARLRTEITAALVAREKLTPSGHVWLVSARAGDLEAVLAAYDPVPIENLRIDDCIRGSLPAGLARFSNTTYLSLGQNDLAPGALRGLSLQKLTTLSLMGTAGIRELTRHDLAGFPRLATLVLVDTPLEALDVRILEVCPSLRRVMIERTPFARDSSKVSALQAQWKDVAWE